MTDFLSKGEHVVGVDIGGTKLMVVVYDHTFKEKGRNKRKSKSKKGEPTEERLTRTIQEALEDAKVTSVQGIGVGSPGPLNPKTGVIIDTPNLAWKDFPLAEYLKKQFKTPVVVDNDVNVGTYGEYRFGEISDCESVLGVFPGTGIGAGIIIDRKIFYGFSGAAGEFGHMTIQVDGPYCGCGKRGQAGSRFRAHATDYQIGGQAVRAASHGHGRLPRSASFRWRIQSSVLDAQPPLARLLFR
ncbi:MAG: ROK family protein, partial [Candidatus Hydrogenedentota bacterium]